MNNVKRYCIPNVISSLIVSLMFLLFGAISVSITSKYGDETEIAASFTIMIFCCLMVPIVIYNMYGAAKLRFEKRCKACKNRFSDEIIESDYENSRAFLDNKVKAGKYMIFGQGTGQFALYDDIRSISLHRSEVHSAGVSVTWLIQIKTTTESFTLYTLKKCSTSKWDEFVEYIETVAPNINIEKMKFSSIKIGTEFHSYPGNPYYRQ